MVSSVGRKTNTLVLVERFLGGREFCIAMMGAGPAGAFAFSPVERHLETDEKVRCVLGWLIGKEGLRLKVDSLYLGVFGAPTSSFKLRLSDVINSWPALTLMLVTGGGYL